MRKKGLFLSVLLAVCSFLSLSFNVFRVTAEAEGGYSKAECVMEVNSRRILYEESGELRLPMASTTKIVTLMTVLSHCHDLSEKVTIPKEAEGVEGSSVYLKSGDIYTVEELLYGLMLRSGNDCATALAWHISGDNGSFSALMNETAERAGALNSRFQNPHGLPCKGHYTTARDLTGIACLGMQDPTFRKIVGTGYYAPRGWKNKNKILSALEGGNGIKTGYTREAGRCLVASATREDMTLVCTVLSCPTMFERAATLLNDVFEAYRYTQIVKKNAVFALETGKGETLEDRYYPLSEGEKEFLTYTPISYKRSIKSENGREIIGHLEIRLAKQLLFSEKLYKL